MSSTFVASVVYLFCQTPDKLNPFLYITTQTSPVLTQESPHLTTCSFTRITTPVITEFRQEIVTY